MQIFSPEIITISPIRSPGSSNRLNRLGLVHDQDQLIAGRRRPAANDIGHIGALGQIGGGKAAQRAVMHHIRVGDRQDHARRALSQPLVHQVLGIDHVGREPSA